jgi:hypothetical protein
MNRTSICFLLANFFAFYSLETQATQEISIRDSTAGNILNNWEVFVGTNISTVFANDGINVFGEQPSWHERRVQGNGLWTSDPAPKVGFSVALGKKIEIANRWSTNLHFLFQQKGVKSGSNSENTGDKNTLNYASARQFVTFDLTNSWSVKLGIEESFLVHQRLNVGSETFTLDFPLLEEIAIYPWGEEREWGRTDLSILTGAAYQKQDTPFGVQVIAGLGMRPVGYTIIYIDDTGAVFPGPFDKNLFINASLSYRI